MINEALREHTTSIGFNLTLSKNMIAYLVLLHHFKGDAEALHKEAHRTSAGTWRTTWITTMKALQNRGLLAWARPVYRKDKVGIIDYWKPYKLTKAGTLMVNLLKEAGIYQETVQRLGLNQEQEKKASA